MFLFQNWKTDLFVLELQESLHNLITLPLHPLEFEHKNICWIGKVFRSRKSDKNLLFMFSQCRIIYLHKLDNFHFATLEIKFVSSGSRPAVYLTLRCLWQNVSHESEFEDTLTNNSYSFPIGITLSFYGTRCDLHQVLSSFVSPPLSSKSPNTSIGPPR